MAAPSIASVRVAHLLQRQRQHDPQGAFTILELLVTVVIGLVLMGSVSTVLTTHIRTASTAEIAQRVRDDSNRLNYLIQTEASEAVTMDQDQTITGCTPAAGATTSIFNLNIPKPTGTAASPSNVSTIFYYASGSDLRRCGPPILQNGSLDHAATPVDSIVSSNTTLVTNITCQSVTSDTRQIAFQATFNDAPGGFQPACAVARAKSFLVRDPTDPAS